MPSSSRSGRRHDCTVNLRGKLTEVCGDIFAQAGDGTLEIKDENLDECVLCRLCLDATPAGTVKVLKLYDDGAEL